MCSPMHSGPHRTESFRSRALKLALELERARCEEKRGLRQFDAVEPENRLVASKLEARWNYALAQVAAAAAGAKELSV